MDHSPGFLAHVEDKRANVHEVSVDEARAALASEPDARLFDVREDLEWAAAHAEGATHLGRGVIERDIEKLVPDKGTPMYLYCGGGFRSALSADALQQMGYTAVHSIAGGWRAWQETGAPIERTAPVARLRVTNLERVVAALREAGANVTAPVAGQAAATVSADDGNRIELWEE
jgi:rhodanese-related sulfurtransferase